MKRTVIGGIISFIGSIWFIGIITAAANNQTTSWKTNLGRFWGTVDAMGLHPFAILAGFVTLLGLIILAIEYFKNNKN